MRRQRSELAGIADVQRPIEDERPPRPLLLGLLAVLVLVVVVLWFRYDPLERGAVTVCPEASRETPLGEPDDPAGELVVCTVSNRDASTIEFATTAANGGLVPVRIRSITLGPQIDGVLTVDELLMWSANNQRVDVEAELVVFEPFTLGPSDERLLWVRAALPDCADAPRDRVLLFRELPVRASVLGLPRDGQIPFDPPVRVIVERC